MSAGLRGARVPSDSPKGAMVHSILQTHLTTELFLCQALQGLSGPRPPPKEMFPAEAQGEPWSNNFVGVWMSRRQSLPLAEMKTSREGKASLWAQMPSRQEWPSRMCCRHEEMDLYMPGAMLGPLWKLILLWTALWAWHYLTQKRNRGPGRLGSGLTWTRLRVPWTPIQCPLHFFSPLQWKRKPKKVRQKWQAVHLAFKCVAAVRPKFPFWSSPCAAWPESPFPWGSRQAGQSTGPGRQMPVPTPHLNTESRTSPVLLSDCDCFVFEISVGLFE